MVVEVSSAYQPNQKNRSPASPLRDTCSLIHNQGEPTDDDEEGAMTPPNEHITPPYSEGNHDKEINNRNPFIPDEPEAEIPLPITEHSATEIEMVPEPPPPLSSYEVEPLADENTDDWGGFHTIGGGVKGKKAKKKGRASVLGWADEPPADP